MSQRVAGPLSHTVGPPITINHITQYLKEREGERVKTALLVQIYKFQYLYNKCMTSLGMFIMNTQQVFIMNVGTCTCKCVRRSHSQSWHDCGQRRMSVSNCRLICPSLSSLETGRGTRENNHTHSTLGLHTGSVNVPSFSYL